MSSGGVLTEKRSSAFKMLERCEVLFCCFALKRRPDGSHLLDAETFGNRLMGEMLK